MATIKLGQRVKDKVTGFKGIAIAKCEYLNGCVQFDIAPVVNEKGETMKNQWIDQQQLQVVDHGILPKPKPDPKPRPRKYASSGGGHRSHPS